MLAALLLASSNIWAANHGGQVSGSGVDDLELEWLACLVSALLTQPWPA